MPSCAEPCVNAPDWWLKRLKNDWPTQWLSVVTGGNRKPPMGLRVNRLRTDATSYRQQLADAGVAVQPALPEDGDEAVLRVQHWLQTHSTGAVPVAAMAAQAGMGERTFLRRFRAATGLKPTEYCQQLRVGKARELLELTNRGIEQVAWAVGYQDPGAFRKVFQKLVGLSPGDYRRRFGIGAPPL